jgi:peptide deformylase
MAVRPIVMWPDARLATPCAPVAAGAAGTDVATLIADMFETMYAAPGRGLAAPQVGVLVRLFVMDCGWKDGARTPRVFLNPRILERSGAVAPGEEGCLSIPGVLVEVTRPARVTLAWQTPEGGTGQETFDGFAARCVQHEIDHLDGLVTFDRLDPSARAEAEAALAGKAS